MLLPLLLACTTAPERQQPAEPAPLPGGIANDMNVEVLEQRTVEADGKVYQYSNPYIQMPGRDEHVLTVGTKACELHAQPISCNLLASWHEQGSFGLPPDPAKATELYTIACDSGHHWSCEKLMGNQGGSVGAP